MGDQTEGKSAYCTRRLKWYRPDNISFRCWCCLLPSYCWCSFDCVTSCVISRREDDFCLVWTKCVCVFFCSLILRRHSTQYVFVYWNWQISISLEIFVIHELEHSQSGAFIHTRSTLLLHTHTRRHTRSTHLFDNHGNRFAKWSTTTSECLSLTPDFDRQRNSPHENCNFLK